ncbi:hypothetical protein ND864_17535 [Leptospira levettii]|uniref:hypothetical protein n=1 Tax=Leptospira levettii TaxID=2023178 RepID=UPI00223D4AE3|nr:hypothetical protein [Leptospira levettii]MCW7467526.1 hypothetical protein [Leptospira levettii]
MNRLNLNEIYKEVLSANYHELWGFIMEGKTAIVLVETEEPFFGDEKKKYERVAILGISSQGYCRFGTPGIGYGPIKFEDYSDFERHMIYYNLKWVKA